MIGERAIGMAPFAIHSLAVDSLFLNLQHVLPN